MEREDREVIVFCWWAVLASPQAIAFEACNGKDDDGDGLVDEGPIAISADEDGDGAGRDSSLVLITDCSAIPPGSVSDASDCDDTDPERSPAATERCDAIDDDCDGLLDEGACPGALGAGEGHAWLVETSPLSWTAAEDSCEALGWHLATPDDASQQEGLERLVLPYADRFWIGLSDREDEDEFVWVDDAPGSYTNWAEDEPNDLDGEDCVALDDEGEWEDRDCAERNPYACERPCADRTWYLDADSDGLGDPETALQACERPPSRVANAADCDDADDGQPGLWFLDEDGDGYGASALVGCHPEEAVADGGDCDDADPGRYPGAPERPGETIDRDCDGQLSPEEPEAADAPETASPADPADTDRDGVPDPIDPAPLDAGGEPGRLPPAVPGCTCATQRGGGLAALLLTALLAGRRRSLRQRLTM